MASRRAIGLIFFGAVDRVTAHHGNFVNPATTAEIELDRAARAHRTTIGPFEPSAWHGIQVLNASASVPLFFAGASNRVGLRRAAAGRLRTLTLVNLVLIALPLTITPIHQFPPPMFFAGACLATFTASQVRQHR